ncbi:MAG: DUF4910 domain-containing protein [Desulfurococcales archaeon]|nr:DUF4910 domain-containing protein [Desulfurococcales archaeon]
MGGIARELLRFFSKKELLSIASELSSFHRIQSTEGLVRGAEFIEDALSAVDPWIEVSVRRFSYGNRFGLLGPVVGWSINDGELWLVRPSFKLLHTFNGSKTFVVAHSPGGSVEGEVVYVEKGDIPKSYEDLDVEGKVVLSSGSPYATYVEASKRGAVAVMLFREGAPPNAVPYLSLFLTPEEARAAKALAVSVSAKVAGELRELIDRGEKPVVRIEVDAEFREPGIMPVVSALLGDGDEEIHLVAHYCHPGGTVNDNVSGSAALIELAIAFARGIRSHVFDEPSKHSIRFLWVPEHYGTTAYLSRNGKAVFSINLDMIGEKQEITGSTLNFIRPPASLLHPYEAIAYRELVKVLRSAETISGGLRTFMIRFDTLPYSPGSDHDVYIAKGIPGSMGGCRT